MMAAGSMLGSPDSGLSTDQHLRPILSNDFDTAFLPTSNTNLASTLSDQLGNNSYYT